MSMKRDERATQPSPTLFHYNFLRMIFPFLPVACGFQYVFIEPALLITLSLYYRIFIARSKLAGPQGHKAWGHQNGVIGGVWSKKRNYVMVRL